MTAYELAGDDALERRRGATWRALLGSFTARAGIALVALCVLVFVIGPFVAPYGPTETGVGPPASGPSWSHPFGTDALGRDVLSRFLTGGAGVILAPILAIALAFAVGGLLGMLIGYRGGWLDRTIARGLDVLMAIPALVLALVIIARWGGSTTIVVVTVAVVFAPRVAVVLRGAVRGVRNREYVRAAEARGDSTIAVLGREVLPNVTGPTLVEFGIRLTYAVLFVATMNVLGFGAQPPSSNWGLMVSESREIITLNPIAAVAPALGIAVLVVGINLVADALAAVLNREAAVASA